MDEISQVHGISMQKTEFLGKLRAHCVEKSFDIEEAPNQLNFLIQRIDEAVVQI